MINMIQLRSTVIKSHIILATITAPVAYWSMKIAMVTPYDEGSLLPIGLSELVYVGWILGAIYTYLSFVAMPLEYFGFCDEPTPTSDHAKMLLGWVVIATITILYILNTLEIL
jgi:hypothetical protein